MSNASAHIPAELLRLKPMKAAKVSEISEATAASSVPAEERVNFHIGNPVQDERLRTYYFRLAAGVDFDPGLLEEGISGARLRENGWEPEHATRLRFLYNSIALSAPYMPRGGFTRQKPSYLVKELQRFLAEGQYEPLEYDAGEKSGKRELNIFSGGILEAYRMLLHTLANHLLYLPATIYLLGVTLPEHLCQFEQLRFITLPDDEPDALEQFQGELKENPDHPAFLITAKQLSESGRRTLRIAALDYPVFYVEAVNLPNHYSLAREAKLENRVLRLLTPGIFSERLTSLPLCFAAGSAEYIKALETVHFQLKGTPSAPEVEWLSYLLRHKEIIKEEKQTVFEAPDFTSDYDYLGRKGIGTAGAAANRLAKRAGDLLERSGERLEASLNSTAGIAAVAEKHINRMRSSNRFTSDAFSGLHPSGVMDEFFNRFNDTEFQNELENSFRHSFLQHHPEYDSQSTFVVSGSARTGLGLLGYHAGIRELITPDMSWTYEHCFPVVRTVALEEDLEIDVDAIIAAVERRIQEAPDWRGYGAVALNNPHNASGKIFSEERVKRLIAWLVERDIYVIDDLSYENVAPSKELQGPKTTKQLALDLVKTGAIRASQLRFVITVHSLSKTDSYAGARLAVMEVADPPLRERFARQLSTVAPNVTALLISYLLYRNAHDYVKSFWRFRNEIFLARMNAIAAAVEAIPAERNQFCIGVISPEGSMYPRLTIGELPGGISLDWLASGLAQQGIGMVPFSTFARTSKGYEVARTTFRLTLGGKDGAEELRRKTRRVIIDLNRLIAKEAAQYNRKRFASKPVNPRDRNPFTPAQLRYAEFEAELSRLVRTKLKEKLNKLHGAISMQEIEDRFENDFLPLRLGHVRQKFDDRLNNAALLLARVRSNRRNDLTAFLRAEFYKETLEERSVRFRGRMFDRTVHPTQAYSLTFDIETDELIAALLLEDDPALPVAALADTLADDFLAIDTPINSIEEGQELICDLRSFISAEEFSRLHSDKAVPVLLSFWGDWDGSTRPSGQGHHLVASALMENVQQLADVIRALRKAEPDVEIPADLRDDLNNLEARKANFWKLFTEITYLTNTLEKRYQRVLPYNSEAGGWQRFKSLFRFGRDPFEAIWQHNDRLEKKMRDLRRRRRNDLAYYFALNKKLRKAIYALLPVIEKNLNHTELALRAGGYRNLLRRFILTPRIHQKMIVSRDQFGIDTTIENLLELNEISGSYGNPGVVLALQVSMSTKPEALIALDRKIRAARERMLREMPDAELPHIWCIPLFEDVESIKNLENYLDRIWEYAIQSSRLDQPAAERFSEMICELFVAGSDLSQGEGQAASASLFREAKLTAIRWLAERGLVGKVRIKLGSGEPMQRQGGYYSPKSGKRTFIQTMETEKRFKTHLRDSTRTSTRYATTPLRGIFTGGDLRTYQSNVSERLRHIPAHDLAQLLYHVRHAQKFHDSELQRAAEPLLDTRLKFRPQGYEELERLAYGKIDQRYNEFLQLVTANFRQILYGRDEDVVGIHAIAYFLSRTTPALRDRPTVRPSDDSNESRGQKIIEQMASTIPLSRHGSLLRAIGHNRSQTAILGVNQLTTGLFRALDEFARAHGGEADGYALISDKILPHLPVFEILHTLRLYHDPEMVYLNRLEMAFPAGNSAFLALREDINSMSRFIGLLQKELIRRQGLSTQEFFDGDMFIPDLLPAIRPDHAVLLQPDLFNMDLDAALRSFSGSPDARWLEEFTTLLSIPVKIRAWRARIWDLLEKPIYQQVESFVKLAMAINKLSESVEDASSFLSSKPSGEIKVRTELTEMLRGSVDDSMRQFLNAAVHFLTHLPPSVGDVPIDILRALKDVEQIIKIDEMVLKKEQMDVLRFYMIQIARICDENG